MMDHDYQATVASPEQGNRYYKLSNSLPKVMKNNQTYGMNYITISVNVMIRAYCSIFLVLGREQFFVQRKQAG